MSSNGSLLAVELREVFPTTTAVLGLELRMWADNVVAGLVADFDATSRTVMPDR